MRQAIEQVQQEMATEELPDELNVILTPSVVEEEESPQLVTTEEILLPRIRDQDDMEVRDSALCTSPFLKSLYLHHSCNFW